MLKLCSNCNKNPAVVYFSSGSEKKHLCIPCAKAAGIPLPEGFPQSEEDMKKMSGEINSALSELLSNADPDILAQLENTEQDGAPSIDFSKLMGFMQNSKNEQPGGAPNPEGNENGKNEQANPFGIKKKNPLSHFCINLTDRAKNDKLDRIIGRERELERVIQILSRRQKNNPCLIGEPGVGKTAIAEALAQKIVAGAVPYRLRK